MLLCAPSALSFQTRYAAVLHHLHYHPDLKTYALYHLHDRMFLKLKQGCHSPSFPLTSKLQLSNFPILIYDSFLRRHWIFLTRSMMSSSTWWDQTSILLLPSLIWLTRLFHHYHHNHDQNHIGDLIQVDNLLWDSEEGEGRQFRRGLFIVIILSSERSSFVAMRHFVPAEELNSQTNQLFF